MATQLNIYVPRPGTLAALVSYLACWATADIVFGQSASFSGDTWVAGIDYRAGILSAFKEVNDQGGVNNRTLRLVSLDDQYIATNVPANVAQLLREPNLLALVGFTGSSPSVVGATLATAAKMPYVGALTGTPDIRRAQDTYVINLRSGYVDGVVTMLKLLVEKKLYKRISLVYQNDSFGIPAKVAITAAMENMKLSLAGLHAYTSAATENFDARAAEVWAKRPQGIVMFTAIGFFKPLVLALKRVTNEGITFVTGSWMNNDVRDFLVATPSIDPTNFYQTQVVPHPLSTTSNISADYRRAIRAYDGRTAYDYVSLEGYALGRFLIEALWRTLAVTPAAFLDAIYRTKMFDLDEMLAGPYSTTCLSGEDATEAARSSLCFCNQGLRYVETTQISSSYEYVTASDFTYPITQCSSSITSVQRPVLWASFVRSNSSHAVAGLTRTQSAMSHADVPGLHFINNAVEDGLPANVSTTRMYEIGNRSLLLGALSAMFIAPQDSYPVIPLFAQPALPAVAFQRNVLHVLATLQQEMFVNAKHLATVHNSTALYLLFSERYEAVYGVDIVKLVEESLETFNRAPDASIEFGDSTPLEVVLSAMPSSGTMIVLGLRYSSEVSALVAFLTKNEQMTLYLPFSDVALYWDILQEHNNCETLPQRVVFSTGLPNWMDPSSEFVAAYQAAVPAADIVHPLSAMGYALGRFVGFVVDRTGGDVEPSTFLSTLYRTSVVTVNEMTFGPFVETQCSDSDCLCNVGPRQVNTFRISSLLSASAAETTVRFSDCKVTYKLHAAKGLNVLMVALVATLLPLFVFVLLGVGGYYAKRKLKVAHAPKDASKKFCTMFVSLKKESVLWEQVPFAMAEITSRYTSVLRSAVSKSECYEVKMVGSAMMIVAKEPDRLLDCACVVTAEFAKIDWKAIVSSAKAKMKRAAQSAASQGGTQGNADDSQLGPGKSNDNHSCAKSNDNRSSAAHSNARESSAVASSRQSSESARSHYSKLEDLSVGFGIGVHRDLGRITYNESDNAYDYSGPCVDGAAVVSDAAAGDQVLVSQAAGTGAYEESRFTPYTTITLKKQEVKLLQFNPPGQAVRVFELNTDDANIDSIATALEQQTSGVAAKKIVVLEAFCPALQLDAKEQSREEFAASYVTKLKRIQEMVHREKAHLQSFTGGRLTITFNAAGPTPQAVRRAYIIANELLEEDFELGELTCGIACGKALVGNFKNADGQHNAVIGGVPEMALRLEMLCRMYADTCVLTTEAVMDELQLFALSQYIDIVRFPGSAKANGVLSIMGFKPVGANDEWMYELEGGAKADPYTATNAVYEKLLGGCDPNSEEVSSLVQKIPQPAEGATKMLGATQLDSILTACRGSPSLDAYLAGKSLLML